MANEKFGNWSFEELTNNFGYSRYEENSKLSEEQVLALGAYIDNTYKVINRKLRENSDIIEPKWINNVILNIDSAIEESQRIPKDAILFRGITLGFRNGAPYQKLEEIFDLAYMSTSLNSNIAINFADELSEKGSQVLMIYSDRNFYGLPLTKFEEEILLPRGTRLLVMEVSKKDGISYALAQICESKGCSKKVNDFAKEEWNRFISKYL